MNTVMKYMHPLIVSIVAVFAPIQSILTTVAALIAIDMITGIARARQQKIPISARRLKDTVVKFMVYEVSVMVAFLSEKYLLDNAIPAVKILSAMIGAVELKSILENLNSASGQGLLQGVISKIASRSDDTKDVK